jgi:predicted nucleic acid-binding protein
VAASESLLGQVVTTEYVVVEAGGLLNRRDDRLAYANMVREIRSDPTVLFLPASQELFQAGFDLFVDRPDKEWSLVDCISFVVMKRRRLADALTADHHFIQAGFRALLLEG